ncbi:MAG: hypothetical protein LBE92_10790 [Chryseobacterium sp.]|jgi:hypothetical protein|uniref:hypothetical protein n=1 Tax=Chryseobacterium sp. TaxID=1871047 RepID=UPI00281D9B37|nr:hypothetical protein [Chryseobacterium sp.]MDR2236602.1 hypothetical protein [Chryseobacterium sp.]
MKKFFLILFAFQLFSCQKESKATIEDKKDINTSNITKIEDVLKKQLNAGMSGLFEETTDGETYQYTSQDLDAIIPLQKEKLKLSGFRFLTNSGFNDKVNEIFGRIIDSQSQLKYLYATPLDKCEKNIVFNRNKYTASINPPSYYIIKNENFITDLYAIPEIIDYQKKYSNISMLEDNINTNTIIDGNNVKLNLWKDADDLQNRRYFNEQLLVNRNKYLFNDNKASLVWLKSNDEYFLESLVKIFGYTKDKDLLGWVMKRNESKANDFVNQFLFVRNCKGELEIREGILKYIEDHTTEDEKTQNYVNAIASYDVNDKNNNWNDKEIIKIRAYIANTYDFLFMKYQNIGNTNIGRFSYLGLIFYNSNKENSKDWQQIEENFKQNNYYHLPHLKNVSSFALEFESGAFY